MSDLDLLTVSGGQSVLMYSFGSTGSGQTSGSMDARLWCGDTGEIYVYNLQNHLYRSSNGGGSFTDIFPDASVPGIDNVIPGRVTAICQYDERLTDPASTGSGASTTEIFITATSGSTAWSYSSTGSSESTSNWFNVGEQRGSEIGLTKDVSDAIEDIKSTAGILAGNRFAVTVGYLCNDHRIYRSSGGQVPQPDTPSDTGLMPGQYGVFTVGAVSRNGYALDSGVAITDLENALT